MTWSKLTKTRFAAAVAAALAMPGHGLALQLQSEDAAGARSSPSLRGVQPFPGADVVFDMDALRRARGHAPRGEGGSSTQTSGAPRGEGESSTQRTETRAEPEDVNPRPTKRAKSDEENEEEGDVVDQILPFAKGRMGLVVEIQNGKSHEMFGASCGSRHSLKATDIASFEVTDADLSVRHVKEWVERNGARLPQAGSEAARLKIYLGGRIGEHTAGGYIDEKERHDGELLRDLYRELTEYTMRVGGGTVAMPILRLVIMVDPDPLFKDNSEFEPLPMVHALAGLRGPGPPGAHREMGQFLTFSHENRKYGGGTGFNDPRSSMGGEAPMRRPRDMKWVVAEQKPEWRAVAEDEPGCQTAPKSKEESKKSAGAGEELMASEDEDEDEEDPDELPKNWHGSKFQGEGHPGMSFAEYRRSGDAKFTFKDTVDKDYIARNWLVTTETFELDSEDERRALGRLVDEDGMRDPNVNVWDLETVVPVSEVGLSGQEGKKWLLVKDLLFPKSRLSQWQLSLQDRKRMSSRGQCEDSDDEGPQEYSSAREYEEYNAEEPRMETHAEYEARMKRLVRAAGGDESVRFEKAVWKLVLNQHQSDGESAPSMLVKSVGVGYVAGTSEEDRTKEQENWLVTFEGVGTKNETDDAGGRINAETQDWTPEFMLQKAQEAGQGFVVDVPDGEDHPFYAAFTGDERPQLFLSMHDGTRKRYPTNL